jgi:DNA recombination protein RmuC
MTIALLIIIIIISIINIIILILKKNNITDEKLHEKILKLNADINRMNEQISNEFRINREEINKVVRENRDELAKSFTTFSETFTKNVKDFNELQRTKFTDLLNKQDDVKKEIEIRLEKTRETVEKKLGDIQKDNTQKLDDIRKTVDEKLQESINKKFNESFELISKRLEEVQKGLGEMQTLAADVGGLKKVLTNVKTRGTFGEVQLRDLLEQILNTDQFDMQAQVKKNSLERVDAVIKLPGQREDNKILLLPIDSKYPIEDYQRLIDAYQDSDNKEYIDSLRSNFEKNVKKTAKDIADKYINIPDTTDFAIMFVPSEGIFAEILRCPGLMEFTQNNYQVSIVGPTNLWSVLISLKMGFRTLAI